MGKGNRTRNDRATSALAAVAPRKTKANKKGMPSWAGTAIVIAVLVLLVAIVVFSALNARGTFLRMRVVAETENFEFTVPMMAYLVYNEYENLSSMYSGIPGGEGGSALNTSTALTDQIYSQVTGENGQTVTTTWFDYFASIAEADAKQILVCCEAATAAGDALSEEDLAMIDTELASIESTATLYGYTMTSYLQMMYGNGILEKDVRAVMELTQLASNWSEKKSAEFEAAVTEDRIEEYYNENKITYDVYCDYISISFEALFTPSTKEDADEAAAENAEKLTKYNDEKRKFADRVAQLTDTETVTSLSIFKEKLEAFLYEDELAAALEKKEEGVELTPEEEAECLQTAKDRVEELVIRNAADGDGDLEDLDEWLFLRTGDIFVRKAGDLKKLEEDVVVETEGDIAYKKSTSVYTAAFFIDGMHRDTSLVHDVGHILFKSDTFKDLTSTSKLSGKTKELADVVLARDGKVTAEAMSKELLKVLFEEGKITKATREDGSDYYKIDKAVFEEYGQIYTEDSSVFYEDVYEGQMVAEFEDWLFDDARVEGEISYPEAIKSTYGYHIMFYVGESRETWESNIHSTIAGKDQNDYLTALQETYTVTITQKNWKYVA